MSVAVTPGSGHKDWSTIVERVHAHYPATADDGFEARARARMDTDTIAAILKDVLRVGHSPVRRGQRVMPTPDEGMGRLRQMRGEDYATAPFPIAFRALARGRSFTVLARKTGIDRTRIQRLLTGTRTDAAGKRPRIKPQPAEMETIAGAFGKSPSYFREWRTLRLARMVEEELASNPELSASLIHRLGA